MFQDNRFIRLLRTQIAACHSAENCHSNHLQKFYWQQYFFVVRHIKCQSPRAYRCAGYTYVYMLQQYANIIWVCIENQAIKRTQLIYQIIRRNRVHEYFCHMCACITYTILYYNSMYALHIPFAFVSRHYEMFQ